MVVPLFISVFAIMLASLAGVIFLNYKLSGVIERNLKILVAFAAGVLVVLVYSLFAEVLEAEISVPVLILSVLCGAIFLEIVDRFIPHQHHVKHDPQTKRLCANRLLVGDAVHNIGDGLLLVPAFLTDVWVGVGATVAIFFHEFVQEIAEFFVLKGGGYSTRQALTRNFIASSTILIGVAVALLASSVEQLETPLVAFGAGGILYAVLRDLLPEVARSMKQRDRGRFHWYWVALVVGVVFMLGVEVVTPHSHDYEADSDQTQAASSQLVYG